jgi:hypothetical protein
VRHLRRAAAVLALGYLAALAVCVLAMRFVGESFWATTVLLYVPRRYFAWPLPVVVLALVVVGPRALLATQLASVALLLFPLGGLVISSPPEASGGPRVRLLSYNGAFGHYGVDRICPEVEAQGPAVLAVQAYAPRLLAPLRECLAGYQVHISSQFLLASRYPIVDVEVPPPLSRGVSANFVRYTLETPLGLIDLFSTHPISPRDGIDRFRGAKSGPPAVDERLLSDEAQAPVRENTQRRHDQIAALSAAARVAEHPVIILGDTNLPGLSHVLATYLGHYQDGFDAVGRGFGYTFPAGRAWMRIDRIMAGPELRFVRFEVGHRTETTHLCVSADVEKR